MKIIGKQIVVELPEKRLHEVDGFNAYESAKAEGRNAALSEVARMNPAWEVDMHEILKIISGFELFISGDDEVALAQALASNPSAWMKRKE